MVNRRESDGENVIIRRDGENIFKDGAFASITIFIIVQTVAWVWWASGTSTTLIFVKDELKLLRSVSTEDFDKATISREQVNSLSGKLDTLRAEFEVVKNNGSPITEKRLTAIEYRLKDLK